MLGKLSFGILIISLVIAVKNAVLAISCSLALQEETRAASIRRDSSRFSVILTKVSPE